jgi:uncharacterized protein YozE (UPF0346 family)
MIMRKAELKSIIDKYRKLANSHLDEDLFGKKAHKYECFADYIEDNEDDFKNKYYETEEELWDRFNEAEAEIDAQWEAMFPEGDDDDSITDFLTK